MSKMLIKKKDIEHIAWLAHIDLSKEEKITFIEQFNEILEYFEKIDETDTGNMLPTYHVLDIVNVYREDETRKCMKREDALKNAPKTEKGFFKAPRSI